MKTGQAGALDPIHTMELLAPAGSVEAFAAALAEGADAVYVGAPRFSARAMAREVSLAEIGAMIRQAHGQGKKLYIAMNSLVREDEVRRVVETLSVLARLGPDALIIQDLGVLYLAQRYFPGLALHASTLMSVHNSLAARHLADLGLQRVVLARELTLEEIGRIGERAGVELEIFVHGAMCFSYSGLCLFSSLHGGRSSLRGQCVQPCRRRYSWQKGGGRSGRGRAGRSGKGGYFFSMNDLSGIDLLPEIRQTGVVSLKIEGRLKSVEYVRKTVRAYRLVLDSLDLSGRQRQEILDRANRLLDEAMGRRRSTGYFLDARPKQAVSPAISGNTGTMIGRVDRMERRRGRAFLQVRLRGDLAVGDRLRLHDEQTGERQAFTLRTLQVGGRSVGRAGAGQTVRIPVPADAGSGGRGAFRGVLFRVDVGAAEKRGGTGRKPAGRVKGRKVEPDRAEVEAVLDDMQWRQGGVASGQRRPGGRQGRGGKKEGHRVQQVEWWVRLRSLRSARRRFPVRPARILVPLDRDNMAEIRKGHGRWSGGGGRLVWCLPPVIQEAALNWFREQIDFLRRAGFPDFQLAHISQQRFFSSGSGQGDGYGQVRLYGDYRFNLLNSVSLGACRRLGLAGMQFSLETDRANLEAALAAFRAAIGSERRDRPGQGMKVGLLVYGRPPLFTARLEADHFRYHQPVASPRGERFVLEQEQGVTLVRASQPFSLLQYRDELLRAGVDYLVLDLSGGFLQREVELLSILLRGNGRQPPVMTGNYGGSLV